jgi:trimethylamine--corrinoid protein Co-methyltransferase
MITLRVLGDDDVRLVHRRSLEILSETGLVLHSKNLAKAMADLGCPADLESTKVRFPPEMVEKAIATTPKRLVLGGLDPHKDVVMGDGFTHLASDGQGSFAVDLETGRRHDSTMEDLARSAILCDGMDYIDIYWPMVIASDVPSKLRTLRELVTCYRYTGKHVQTDVFSPDEVPHFINALKAILGSEDEVRRRKILSVVCCSVSPLQYDGNMLEACAELARWEVPINVLPMPICGATAPVSLLGAVLMNNVEVLGALTIFQQVVPGAPVIFGSSASILDMRTGLFAVGAPEEGLINGACAEMARHYGIPSFASGLASDAKEPGFQAALEKACNSITPVLCGADMLGGVGLLETCQCLYLEQLVFDEEVWGFVNRIKAGINGGDEYVFSDLLETVGPGGHYLAEKSTRELLRKGEHYVTKLISREPHEVWVGSPKRDLGAWAREKVRRLLIDPKEYLEPGKARDIEEMIDAVSP